MKSILLRALAPLLLIPSWVHAALPDLVLTDPAYPLFHATAMDQPRLYGLLTDNGEVMFGTTGPVRFRAFVDTGSSGTVLSNLVAEGHEMYEEDFLGLTENDYIGQYTNLGIGGEEVGWVSRPFGVLLYNDPWPIDEEVLASDFVPYGEHNLWVRKAPGQGEVNLLDLGGGFMFPLVSPVNIVGMPIIEQRVMVMEWKSIPEELADLLPPNAKEMQTKLLPRGDPAIPASNVTLELEMRNFISAPREGETLPSTSRNPLVKDIRISHDPARESVTANWLFDTGAGSSFISFAWAQTIGLIPDTYPDLASFMVDHIAAEGMTSVIGGVGPGTVNVPILTLNEIRIPAREGFDLVWQNVKVLVFEHTELADLDLQGIFGMNLIGPAATLDASLLGGMQNAEDNSLLLLLLLMLLEDISPTPFDSIVFEVTGEDTAELRLLTSRLPAPGGPANFLAWREAHFTAEELADPSISGPAADPGNYGIPNLLRYALGLDAGTPDRKNLPRAGSATVDGNRYLTLTYPRRTGATDISFLLESSADLVHWAPADTLVVQTVSSAETEVVTVRETAPLAQHPRRFLRLRVVSVE